MVQGNLTPLFRQYQEAKRLYPDMLLLFRLGDFYELFGQDAEVAARELELTLTAREFGKDLRLPMCGVPHHAVERYLARLIAKGYRVAICEQVEDPKLAKGLVRREVVRVVTPGTVLEEAMLEAKHPNFLLALRADAARSAFGLAVAEVSTGEFAITEIRGEEAERRTLEEIARLQPAEILLPPDLEQDSAWREALEQTWPAPCTPFRRDPSRLETAEQILAQHFRTTSLRGFGCEGMPLAVEAAADILEYLRATQKAALELFTGLHTYSVEAYMLLDASTRRNLELTQSLVEGQREGSLLWLLDHTRTPMGGRLLRSWLLRPLKDVAAIQERLDAVEALFRNPLVRDEVREALRSIHDLERLATRSVSGVAHARDLVALKRSLRQLPPLKRSLEELASPPLQRLAEQIDDFQELANLIERAIVEEPPADLQSGGLIKEGYSPELDELRRVSSEGKDWIAHLEQRERERTGIRSLKVGYNQVFGYYIEVTKANLHLVPQDYIRKQTLANAERFITPELKEYEALVLGAEERMVDLEYRLFCQVRNTVAAQAEALLRTAKAVAQVDVLASLAEVAARHHYVRPVVDESDVLDLRGGRHPVVEVTQPQRPFVPNDLYLDTREQQMIILTGPNMAGKSTILRQTALIVLMAQMGSFVPAQAARVGVVDRIFTRVGAQDDLATGRSTFMVEMNEAANILNNATPRSLVVLDEIGRGTSTYDGVSIAWAVAEYLHEHVGARTLFATHYHYLNALEERFPRIRNYRMEVREEGESILFLYRMVRGGTDRSYGIEVARLAGLPPEVIQRAREILEALEVSRGQSLLPSSPPPLAPPRQLSLFEVVADPLLEELREELLRLEPMRMTPLEALNWLAAWQQRLKERGGKHG